MIDLIYLSKLLGIIFVFYLFTVRVMYYAMIAKIDPMRAIDITPRFIIRKIESKKAQEKARGIS